MSDLVLAIMSWAGAEERRKISERTKAKLDRIQEAIDTYGYFERQDGKRIYKLGGRKKGAKNKKKAQFH